MLPLLLIGLALWLLWPKESAAPTGVDPLTGLPFGSGEGVVVPTPIDEDTEGEIEPLEEYGTSIETRLFRLTNTPVAGFVILPSSSTTVIRYVDRATGHIMETLFDTNGSLTERRLTNTTLPKVYEAHFRSDGRAVVLRSLRGDSDTIENLSLTLTPPQGTSTTALWSVSAASLRGTIDAMTPGTGDTVFYVAKDSSSIISSTFAGDRTRTLFTSPFDNWRLQKFSNNLLIFTKAESTSAGYVYTLNTNGALTKLIGPLDGLTASANTSGTALLYSHFENGANTFAVMNVVNSSTNTIIPATLASITAVIIGWMNNRQGEKIHVLVNSNMTAVKADLALANEHIKGLQELVSSLSDNKDIEDLPQTV